MSEESGLTHVRADGSAHMVDVSAKAVTAGGQRYIVCINHQQAENDAIERADILAA